jgi:hypothetical protein
MVFDKDTGILLVRLDPLRVSYIARSDIAAYAVYRNFSGIDKAFDEITDSAKTLFSGAPTAGADFCYVADLPPGTWQENRIPFPPLFDGLDYLAGRLDQERPLPQSCADATTDGLHVGWCVKHDDEYSCRKYHV